MRWYIFREYRESELLRLPQYTLEDFVVVFVLFGVLSGIIVILRFYYRVQAKKDACWYILHNRAQRSNFSLEEINLLRSFFLSLNRKEAEKILSGKGIFYTLLNHYLNAQKSVSDRLRVRVLDKLFLPPNDGDEIRSIYDLREGEVCGVEWENENFLGRVVGVKDESILLSFFEGRKYMQKTLPAKLYFYRPRSDGYIFHGHLKESSADSGVFFLDGEIEPADETHLMADIELPIRLLPWPYEKAEVTDSEARFEKNEKEQPLVVRGISEKISDRALTFHLEEGSEVENILTDNFRFWELHLSLPENFQFVCRGKIKLSSSGKGSYIFRYLDLTENSRKVIFSLIKAGDYSKERFS